MPFFPPSWTSFCTTFSPRWQVLCAINEMATLSLKIITIHLKWNKQNTCILVFSSFWVSFIHTSVCLIFTKIRIMCRRMFTFWTLILLLSCKHVPYVFRLCNWSYQHTMGAMPCYTEITHDVKFVEGVQSIKRVQVSNCGDSYTSCGR